VIAFVPVRILANTFLSRHQIWRHNSKCWDFFCNWNNSEHYLKPWSNDHNLTTQHIATLLGAFGHPVTTCWVLLAQVWKWSNLVQQRNTQHVATRRNRVVKLAQHVAPNNVAICCLHLLGSFGPGLKQNAETPSSVICQCLWVWL